MKAYLMTTSAVFGLITLAHLLRMIVEGWHLATEPLFVVFTIVAGGLGLWALLLLRHSRS